MVYGQILQKQTNFNSFCLFVFLYRLFFGRKMSKNFKFFFAVLLYDVVSYGYRVGNLEVCLPDFTNLTYCTIKNFHSNKTHFNWQISLPILSTSIITFKNSSIEKLGPGICLPEMILVNDYSTSIKNLQLSNLKIEEITYNAFDKCMKLEILNLSNNKLESLHPTTLIKNENLRIVDLSHNLFKKLETYDFLSQISELDLSHNQLSAFSTDLIKVMKSMETLRVSYNKLFDINAKKMTEHMPYLRFLALGNNYFRCRRIRDIHEIFRAKNISVDPERDFMKKDEEAICLDDNAWVAAHYIYTYKKMIEIVLD